MLVVRNKNNLTTGIVSDGDIRKLSQKNSDFHLLKVKNIMTKKPITIDKNELAAKALSLMNSKNYFSYC